MIPFARSLTIAASLVVVIHNYSPQGFAQEGADSIVPRLPAPWFENPDVRRHFKLTDEQYRGLNERYQESLSRYQQGLKALDAEADAELRRKTLEALENELDESLIHSIDTVFIDKAERRRYEQFYRRYQGYDIFHTPRLRTKLDLTSEQAELLAEHEAEWNTEVAEIREKFTTDRPAAMRDLKHARRRMEERIQELFTPEQEEVWKSLTGDTADDPEQVSVMARYSPQEPAVDSFRLSELLGQQVTLQDDQAGGEIVDFVGRRDGTIDYAVAAYQEQYYAIPYQAMIVQPGVAGVFIDISPAVFQGLPFFTPTVWPNFYATGFQQQAFGTFGVTSPTDAGNVQAPTAVQGQNLQNDRQLHRKQRSPLDRPVKRNMQSTQPRTETPKAVAPKGGVQPAPNQVKPGAQSPTQPTPRQPTQPVTKPRKP